MIRWRATGLALALAFAAAGVIPAARAQLESREGIALQNQILELRNELAQLRAQGGGGNGAGAPAYEPPAQSNPGSSDISAQLLDRVTQLEDAVRSLRGRIDEIDNARQQSEADLAKQIGDLQFKLNGGAGAGGSAAAGPAAGSATGVLSQRSSNPPPAATTHRTPEVALSAGYAALAKRDYSTAEAAAREVLAGAAPGPRGADAEYLLAQSMTGQRNYAAAAVAYDDAFKRNTRGSHAPASLLGLANSLTALGDKAAACQTLGLLRTQFPTPPVGLRPSIVAARGRAGCH